MTTEEIRKYLWEKWCNYSRGLAMSFAFREDKSYTFKDVKEAFESGFYDSYKKTMVCITSKTNIEHML